jgi:hypothetical protein
VSLEPDALEQAILARNEDAFVYEKRIDVATYERQRDKMREDIALVRIELEDARLEEVDVEGLLGFAEHVLSNAARLWLEATGDQRPRLQRILFPEGLRLKDGRFGTAVTCLAFTHLAEPRTRESGMASPAGTVKGCTVRVVGIAA